MNLLLALDGALGPFSAALIERKRAGFERVLAVPPGAALEAGLASVAALLEEEGPGDIGAIAVSVGPGAFTGLRIALSYAKALAFAWNVPLIGVSSYDAVEPDELSLPLAACVSGRPGSLCARLRSGTETSVACGNETAVAAEIAERLPPGSELWCAGAWQGAAPRFGERGLIVRSSPPAAVPAALAVARKALEREAAPSPHAVRADYGSASLYGAPG